MGVGARARSTVKLAGAAWGLGASHQEATMGLLERWRIPLTHARRDQAWFVSRVVLARSRLALWPA